MSVAIRAENLSKKYIIRHQASGHARYLSLRDAMARKFTSLFRREGNVNPGREEFWALNDVSFEINKGDVVGVIGRNGAGKSTLLKLLSRITEPTRGSIRMNGRVASLLEVGTGFHQELTGRENIFLNGAVLGMGRREIKRKFDEIVAFAETEKFLDTPVKHYSSGMYMRLAFAVAAHLEPEILIVDEVLAVGDAQFQKKCLGKMQDISEREGRTVLFVSHNMTAIQTLCRRAILLESGRMIAFDSVAPILNRYLETGRQIQESTRRQGTTMLNNATLVSIEPDEVAGGWKVCLDIELSKLQRPPRIGIDLILRHDQTAFAFAGSAYFHSISITPEVQRVRCIIGPLNFSLGNYQIDLRVCDPMRAWLEEHDAIIQFTIERQLGSDQLFNLDASRQLGFIIAPQEWTILDTISSLRHD